MQNAFELKPTAFRSYISRNSSLKKSQKMNSSSTDIVVVNPDSVPDLVKGSRPHFENH